MESSPILFFYLKIQTIFVESMNAYMTLKEFQYLSYQEKIQVLQNHGEFADSYTTGNELVKCFSVHRFFVEIYYNLETKTIREINGFVSGISLDKYVINFNNCNNQL